MARYVYDIFRPCTPDPHSCFRRPPGRTAPSLNDTQRKISLLTEGLISLAMEFPHGGESTYYRYEASFARDHYGDLLYCTGPGAAQIRDHWDCTKTSLDTQNHKSKEKGEFYHVELEDELSGLELYELRKADNVFFTGIILMKPNNPTDASRAFEKFFNGLILRQANLAANFTGDRPPPAGKYESDTENIVSLFDKYLRYRGQGDKWIECGRAYFTERVRHFTSQGAKIELCLPAFPCKSSNTNKVTGKDPDRGELLALERLHGFVEAVEKIYDAGAKLWIISDGHVFSDCIGVDDKDVDEYGEKLIKMNRIIGIRKGNVDRVGFLSLVDLFELNRYKSKLDRILQLNIPPIDHHIHTNVTAEAEFCRRILMAGCQSKRSSLRVRIDTRDSTILALYRGFSRFMLEDLELHPFTRALTRSKQKKLSAKVAFEMIMRNQAYSNLVEMLFPNHIRLSIHAHNNAGPKFGIQLFDPATVRAVESLSSNSNTMTSRDLLHIPTPWHNSVVKVVGSRTTYLTKAKVVRDAIARGDMTGTLRAQDGENDSSGAVYFNVCTTRLGGTQRRVLETVKEEEVDEELPEPVTILKVVSSKEGIAS
ncbi:Pyoverdine/dityrosine biosynthesis protein-domain-containing protein [Hypoxylon sp. FL1857]|nr:Pyoverdine/dityrosine biosynthesis protein-domain-containing protein [Hypoxylon sp. FL1857]